MLVKKLSFFETFSLKCLAVWKIVSTFALAFEKYAFSKRIKKVSASRMK